LLQVLAWLKEASKTCRLVLLGPAIQLVSHNLGSKQISPLDQSSPAQGTKLCQHWLPLILAAQVESG